MKFFENGSASSMRAKASLLTLCAAVLATTNVSSSALAAEADPAEASKTPSSEATKTSQSTSPQPGTSHLFPPNRTQSRDPLAIYREAGIDSNQEGQIKQLAKEFEDANAVRLQNVMSQLQQMKALSLKPDPDEQAVIALQEQISKIQAEMAMERIKLLLKIRKLLNPEQKQRLVEQMKKGSPAATN